jgi:hypothetical protein
MRVLLECHRRSQTGLRLHPLHADARVDAERRAAVWTIGRMSRR